MIGASGPSISTTVLSTPSPRNAANTCSAVDTSGPEASPRTVANSVAVTERMSARISRSRTLKAGADESGCRYWRRPDAASGSPATRSARRRPTTRPDREAWFACRTSYPVPPTRLPDARHATDHRSDTRMSPCYRQLGRDVFLKILLQPIDGRTVPRRNPLSTGSLAGSRTTQSHAFLPTVTAIWPHSRRRRRKSGRWRPRRAGSSRHAVSGRSRRNRHALENFMFINNLTG